MEKSNAVLIMDCKENADEMSKLMAASGEKFMFNPSERVVRASTSELKPLTDRIFVSQRPTLFSQKYEATYDYTLPDDPDSQRQNLLTSLERKYQQIFTSRQLHRCLARCVSNTEARQTSPKHLPIDEVEKVIRERLSSVKCTCVEYLETSLSYRKLMPNTSAPAAAQSGQKIESTVEERACYLTHESRQFATLYVSKKHIEQPYFALCLARCLQPLLADLNFDAATFTALIATSVSQMSRLLQLVNVATDENILSVIKLQYVPSSGKLYGDDVNLLAPFDAKFHQVLVGDLCVCARASDGAYVYCQVVEIAAAHAGFTVRVQDDADQENSSTADEDAAGLVKLQAGELFVLENWQRIYDATQAKPHDERETFKYSTSDKDKERAKQQHQQHNDSDEQSEKRANGGGGGGSRYRSGANGNASGGDQDDFSSGNDSDNKSDASSTYGGSQECLSPNSAEIEQSKSEINQELRLVWGLEENERKKKINRLLLKWHPDKNPGKEKFASEVFKHLKKQIEFYKTDPFLAGFYRSSYSSYGAGAGAGTSTATGATGGYGSTTNTAGAGSGYTGSGGATGGGAYSASSDDFGKSSSSSSRHYGSFDDLHRKGSGSPTGGHSPHSSPSRDSYTGASAGGASGTYDYDPSGSKGPGASNLGRAGSFRQEWERRRQQKRQTTANDTSE